MIKHLSRFMIVLWLSVAILTISLFPKNVLADCDSRAYGRFDLYHTATNRYTAVQATIEIAYPTVRDGVLSSEVIWMWGDTLAHSVEMGWRRIPGLYGSNPFAYIGYFDSGSVFHYLYEGNVNERHSYQIEYYPSDGKWHFSKDGVLLWTYNNGSSGYDLLVGGEVSTCAGSNYNAMGPSGILNISYKVNNTGYYSWNNTWAGKVVAEDIGYHYSLINYNSFQNSGHNP